MSKPRNPCCGIIAIMMSNLTVIDVNLMCRSNCSCGKGHGVGVNSLASSFCEGWGYRRGIVCDHPGWEQAEAAEGLPGAWVSHPHSLLEILPGV